MVKKEMTIIIIFAALILLAVAHYFFFNIYETSFIISSKELYADYKSMIKIESIPINSFGLRVPFKNSPTKFEIIEGENLIEIISNDEEKGIFIIRSKGETGSLSLKVKPKYSLLPTVFEINILPSFAYKL